MTEFTFLSKPGFPALAPGLFAILAENMASFDPGLDYGEWSGAVGQGLQADPRQIILIHRDGKLLGFLQYYVNAETFMIEELQLLPACQGRVNFLRQLYGFVLAHIPGEPKYVEAFVHRENTRSLRLQQKLGMEPVGTAQNGKLLHLRGSFSHFANWYNSRKPNSP